LTDLGETLTEQAKLASDTAVLLTSKVDQLNNWEAQCIKACEQVIPARLAQHLQRLRNSISAFVDENIEKSDFGARWNREVETLKLNDWAKAIQTQIIEETKVQLQEFARQLREDAEFFSVNADSAPASFSESDVKRTLKWISVGSSVLVSVAGVAGLIGASNIWNPLGWLAAAVGLGAWVLSWFVDDREGKLQKQKRKTADELRKFVDGLEADVTGKLLFWFRDEVAAKDICRVIAETEALRVGMDGTAKQLLAGAKQIRSMVDALNVRVYSRTAAHLLTFFDDSQVVSVARDPGVLGLAIVSADLSQDGFASTIGKALNEKIVAVVDSDPSVIIKTSFQEFGISLIDVTVSGSDATVKLARSSNLNAHRQQIALTARALGMNIRLEQNDYD
jgi:hypothetical protein